MVLKPVPSGRRMHTTSQTLFARQLPVAALVVSLSLAGSHLPAQTSPPGARAESSPAVPESVRVEIFEGIPDQTSWDFPTPVLSESYREPAFGFVIMPTKYSACGVRVDRSAPFLFRASADLQLPEGDHRLLLRARTGTRLFVDGKL